MKNHLNTHSLLSASPNIDELRSAFSERLGRALTDTERSFLDFMFRDGGIATQSWAWTERFEDAVVSSESIVGDAGSFLDRWGKAFGAGYQEMFQPEEALIDIVTMEEMREDQDICVRAYRRASDLKSRFRFKLYHKGQAAPLADVIKILDHLGLKAVVEEGFPVEPASGSVTWVHEFLVDDPRGEDLVLGEVGRAFEAAFRAIWSGEAENDGFNRLVLELGVSWRDAALVRALAQYRQQSGQDPSQRTQVRAVVEHAGIARLLVDLFHVKFDPDSPASEQARRVRAREISTRIEEELQRVPSLDEDRVLRRLYHLIQAVKRTNFYQLEGRGKPKSYIALKIASRELLDLPEPKPFAEIFVSGPLVEGVHLRFGPVARGGLRWSDRRDDFRAEVLALVKAQQMKNAVIVPVGAKGGFILKGARPDEPAAQREAGIAAYRLFLSGLLDVTDNLDGEGMVIFPPRTVTYDEQDAYLVVAADKGTASFSDVANDVAASYGFWLGDAFASGGSAGYDHKAMGITARGAWEAVKRHFRECGKDIESKCFTVAGVGDMSGDVFGNGMLLSRKTKLLAAFDHRDIFIDPDPDPELSWTERKRLFDLPRSSWQEYNRSKLSKGGGVFSRQLKEIRLSKEAREALALEESSLGPSELIKAILRAPVELLYVGGIGTYVKASSETHLQVSDKGNDAVRIDGSELRARIVAEGANLGFTQAGRIEFARKGGRINSDAIDNSAGVDSSDLEVNIKILTSAVEREGALTRAARDALLASMTDDVADHVLAHNRSQTLALSLMQWEASRRLPEHAEFIRSLEQAGRLNRKVEGLPSAAALAELREASQGLSRPELAVLLAYGKLSLFDELVSSRAPDDPYFLKTLAAYFPGQLDRFRPSMNRHPLKREIVATCLANEIVDVVGPSFLARVKAAVECDAGVVATSYAAASDIFAVRELWSEVQALDGRVPVAVQHKLYGQISRGIRQQTYALAKRGAATIRGVDEFVASYRDPIGKLVHGTDQLKGAALRAYLERVEDFARNRVPAELAARVSILPHLRASLTVADISRECSAALLDVALIYEEVGAAFRIDMIAEAADSFESADMYETVAARTLGASLSDEQEKLTRVILAQRAPADQVRAIVERWSHRHRDLVAPLLSKIDELAGAAGPWNLGRLILASSTVQKLVGRAFGEPANV